MRLNLFAALGYDKREDKYTALFLGILGHLGEASRAALLEALPVGAAPLRVEAQRSLSTGDIADGLVEWPGLVMLVETKVDAGFGWEQLPRYAKWLDEAHYPNTRRVLLALVRAHHAAEVKVQADKIHDAHEGRVQVSCLSWDTLAQRAEKWAVEGPADDPDRSLLLALANHLYGAGLAARPLPHLERHAVAQALSHSRALLDLRNTLHQWMSGFVGQLPGQPDWWKVYTRQETWVELSVVAERYRPFVPDLQPPHKQHWPCWWVEAYAPWKKEWNAEGLLWPPAAQEGVIVRAGFMLTGKEMNEIGRNRIRKALAASPDGVRVHHYDRHNYSQTWWLMPIDPFDLPNTGARVAAWLQEQDARVKEILG